MIVHVILIYFNFTHEFLYDNFNNKMQNFFVNIAIQKLKFDTF